MATYVRAGDRPLNYTAITEVLLLGGTALLLLVKWLRGQIPFYIHPRYTALVVVAGVILLLMAIVRARAIYAEQSPNRPG